MSKELIEEIKETITICKKVNPHNEKTAWRSQGEKYNNRPSNYTEYYNDYYKLHCKDRINCDKCGKNILLLTKSRHQKSLHCKMAFLEQQIKSETTF